MSSINIKTYHKEVIFQLGFDVRASSLVQYGGDYLNEQFRQINSFQKEDLDNLIDDKEFHDLEKDKKEHIYFSVKNAIEQKLNHCFKVIKESKDLTTYDHSKYRDQLTGTGLHQGDRIGNTSYAFIEEMPFSFIKNHNKGFSLSYISRTDMTCSCCHNKAEYFIHCMSHKRHYHILFTKHMEPLTVDHVIPRARGGRDSETNFQVMCQFCNVLKGDDIISMEELRSKVENIRPNFINYF
jgi:5-methylcytosine-specific restriction endonuclease McrA